MEQPSTATPSMQTPEQPTPGLLKSDKPKYPRGQKRPFLKNKHNNSSYSNVNSSGKRGHTSFEKKSDSIILSVFTLLPVFELYTSFYGVLDVSRAFYAILQSRDRKMTALLTEDDLTYTLLMCVYYRCALVANSSKTKIIFGLSCLKTLTEHVLLPDVLAQFVEAFGTQKLSNSATIVPYFSNYREMRRQPGFVDPEVILRRLGLEPSEGDWSIHTLPVLTWEQASSRALKNAMELRPVRYSELEGRPELLGCYEVDDTGTYRVSALDKIDVHQAQLGAACRFRPKDYSGLNIGLALPPLFGAPDINQDLTLTGHVLKALRQ